MLDFSECHCHCHCHYQSPELKKPAEETSLCNAVVSVLAFTVRFDDICAREMATERADRGYVVLERGNVLHVA